MQKNSSDEKDVERLAGIIRTFIRVLLVSGRTGQPAKGLIPFNPLYFHFLGYLLDHGCSRPSQLAEHLGVARSTLSTASRALQKRELVETQQDPNDGRAQLLSLTSTGKEIALAIRDQDEENMRVMLSFIDPDDKERTLQVLEGIAHKLGQL